MMDLMAVSHDALHPQPHVAITCGGRLRAAVETMRLLESAGPSLREQTERACARGPAWAVFVGDAKRVRLADAPLEIVLGVVDRARHESFAVALPVEMLVRVLELGDDQPGGAALTERLRDVPSDCCPCVVATTHGLLAIRLPRDRGERPSPIDRRAERA